MRKKPLVWGAVGVVVLGVFGLYWFQPWKLFTSKTVNEVAPVVVVNTPSAQPFGGHGGACWARGS